MSVQNLKAEIDAEAIPQLRNKAGQMMPWHYQDRFFQEAPRVGSIDLDRYFKGKKVDQLAQEYYTGIGLPVDEISEQRYLRRKGKYQHAFENDIDRAGDIRVMLSVETITADEHNAA